MHNNDVIKWSWACTINKLNGAFSPLISAWIISVCEWWASLTASLAFPKDSSAFSISPAFAYWIASIAELRALPALTIKLITICSCWSSFIISFYKQIFRLLTSALLFYQSHIYYSSAFVR